MNGLRVILSNLLSVNPYFRWTPKECLAHPMFDDIRDPSNEVSCNNKIYLPIHQEGAFDYEEGIGEKYKKFDLV